MNFSDQMNRIIRIDSTPMRIISLVPSQTELLYDLGLEDRVVGITKFCIHPQHWQRSKTRIGGTKKINLSKVKALKPDLIIGNKEENEQADILALEKIAPVWMSDIYTLNDALHMIASLGEICAKKEASVEMCHQIQERFSVLKNKSISGKVIYLIWKKPYMAVAKNTFIDAMLSEIGLSNAFSDQERYPEWNPEQSPDFDFLFLSTEPYPFNTSDLLELREQFPKAKVVLVDGEYFSWYGSRLVDAPNYFENLNTELGFLN